MSSTIKKIVECTRDGKLLAAVPLAYGHSMGSSVPPDLIKEAKEALTTMGLVTPPFDFTGISYCIRDA